MAELGFEPEPSSARPHGHVQAMLCLKTELSFSLLSILHFYLYNHNEFRFFLTAHIKLLTHRAPFIPTCSFPTPYKSLKNIIKDCILFNFNLHFFDCCWSNQLYFIGPRYLFVWEWLIYIICPFKKLKVLVYFLLVLKSLKN